MKYFSQMDYKIIARIVSVVCLISGIVLLASVLLPIALYEIESREKFPALISPMSTEGLRVLGQATLDSTHASNWFIGGAEEAEFNTSNVTFYTISIPQLGIENATVQIGGDDLSKHLIQYPGTALPGKVGNAVIFGHSILPRFYDPKNYISIFSTLPVLEKGSEVVVNFDGITYTYRVESKFEVLPTDLQVLDQNSHDSYLTLVTCVPPGHPLKPRRLIVRAKMVPIN